MKETKSCRASNSVLSGENTVFVAFVCCLVCRFGCWPGVLVARQNEGAHSSQTSMGAALGCIHPHVNYLYVCMNWTCVVGYGATRPRFVSTVAAVHSHQSIQLHTTVVEWWALELQCSKQAGPVTEPEHYF